MNCITLDGVAFRYGSKEVLNGISFTCREGELTGILGENGCGKTTLLRIMAGYLKPQAGSVAYNSQPAAQLSARRLAQMRAVVEQRLTSPFEFPVFDYVMLGRTPYLGRFKSETLHDYMVVEESLRLTGTTHLQDRNAGSLSGGELQRVMIARAHAQEPDFLMLDEPTAHLDIRHQLEIMDLLRGLSETTAVIAVIHDLNHAARFCDRVIVIGRKGSVAGDGVPDEVLHPDLIKDVFSVNAATVPDPASPRSYRVFSLPAATTADKGMTVHVISGGGAGRYVISALHASGYQVTVGVLNEGDLDLGTAESLGCHAITAPPFSRITAAQGTELERWCLDAGAVVVVPVPVGKGNLANLEAVHSVAGKRAVIFMDTVSGYDGLDHADGRAAPLYRGIRENAVLVKNIENLLEVLEEMRSKNV